MEIPKLEKKEQDYRTGGMRDYACYEGYNQAVDQANKREQYIVERLEVIQGNFDPFHDCVCVELNNLLQEIKGELEPEGGDNERI